MAPKPIKKTSEPIEAIEVKGQQVIPGTEMEITGERGRFRFKSSRRTSDDKLVLTFVGGVSGEECWRSFYAERVKKVY
jgi:hypothetical protein